MLELNCFILRSWVPDLLMLTAFDCDHLIPYLIIFTLLFCPRSFNFEDMRIDEALRLYLENFRLPGESPVISWIMEHFAEHWHVSGGS